MREVVRDERAYRRDMLDRVLELGRGKLREKAVKLRMGLRCFDEWVEELGGEEAAVRYLCWNVGSGVSLKVMAEEFGWDKGLAWELLSRDEVWLMRYRRALEGMAEEYVLEAVGIADGVSERDEVPAAALQTRTRLDVAKMLSKERFGGSGQGGGGGGITVVVQRGGTEPPVVSDGGRVLTITDGGE